MKQLIERLYEEIDEYAFDSTNECLYEAAYTIESLAEENAALSTELSEGTKCYADLMGRFESLTAERDALRAQLEAANRGLECYRLQLEKDSKQSDLEQLVAQGLEIAALKAEIAKMREPWQPIETAPKDGRTLLMGYANSHGNWRTLRGQWFSNEEIEEWEDPELAGQGWYETPVEIDDTPNCFWTEPTHWMPLPPPPGAQP